MLDQKIYVAFWLGAKRWKTLSRLSKADDKINQLTKHAALPNGSKQKQ